MNNGDCFMHMYRFDNGFTVELKDPGIVKYNIDRDKKNSKRGDSVPYLEYKDPWKSFVFDDEESAVTFVSKNIGKAISAAKIEETTDYDTAWDLAVAPAPASKK